MRSEKIRFKNRDGLELDARIELPETEPTAYAIFAHCFTCNKNLTAVRNISKTLTAKNIAVLLFDFTGLGASEGDFSDTNFSSNIADLFCAADYLEANYQAPKLLIGHSLGGAAVLSAASEIESVKAVATIGAPSSAAHVAHLVKSGLSQIEEKGQAEVNIGGKPFTIKKQFIDDIEASSLKKHLQNFHHSVLIMHSPEDRIVGIENAAEIYKLANHPKSFISLSGADHLLSDAKDSEYVGEAIASWAKRYID